MQKNKNEILGGLTTFFTMSYIVVVNPSILATEGTGMSFPGVLTGTVLLCFIMTMLMGLYAKLPYAVAPGMGINAFFTYSIVLGKGIPWQTALGITFWAGILFLIISVTPLREKIAKAIPQELRIASAAGIGLFIAFIGLKNAGFIAADGATLVKLGKLDGRSLFCIFGLLIITFFMRKKNPFSFLFGIFSVTLLGFAFGYSKLPETFFSLPDFKSTLFHLDFISALNIIYVPALISILFTDFFDSISTFVGIAEACNLTDENGDPRNLKEGLVVDALATAGAGLLGTSSGTAYIESAAGVEMGGRTGLSSVITALCFLPCLFIAPLAASVPVYATAPVLIMVGALMFRSVLSLKMKNLEDLIPVFLSVLLIPLTFSITQGILWGFISHVVLYFLVGRGKEVHPLMTAIALISSGLIFLEARA